MRLPQFSLKTLAGIVAFAAVACCSLVYASGAWSATIYSAAIVFLAFATLAAVYSRGRRRAFWSGAAFSGWLYLLLALGPMPGTQQMTSPTQVNVDSELATTHLGRWLYEAVLPKLRKPPEVVGLSFTLKGPSGSMGVSMPGSMGEGAMPGGAADLYMVTGMGGSVPMSSPAAQNYPDAGSFIRVFNALCAWLFALSGGLAGRWLFYSSRQNASGMTVG